MSCKEVVTFWLDMGAPISLLSRILARPALEKRRMPRQVGRSVGSALVAEPPAGGAVRLLASDPEHGLEDEPVEMPGRRPCAWRAEGCSERVARHLGRPASFSESGDDPLERLLIRHAPGLAVEIEIDAFQSD